MSDLLTKTAPRLDELRARRDEILRVAEHYGAYNVRVFGSVARGEATVESDIDLLVQFPSSYKLLHHAGLVSALKALLNHGVDVSVEQNLRESYRESILRDAVPL